MSFKIIYGFKYNSFECDCASICLSGKGKIILPGKLPGKMRGGKRENGEIMR
jgi:hypothetical protein